MKTAILIARIVTGIAFLFSGTVKAIDPLGSAYKFQDYFTAFNLSFLTDFSLPFAVLLCTIEFMTGFCILTGIRIRAGITMLMILMIVFTPLTFVLALTNPVSDCGCFGDAIHLTNWQTFWKNVVLIVFAFILYKNRKRISEYAGTTTQLALVTISAFVFILFALYNLRYLPVIDFLPYSKGVKIADKMVVPEGATPDVYETIFIYEKDGVKKEFTLNDYPANDSTWKFVDQKSTLQSKGYEPEIHDFTITGYPSGEDLTGKILETDGYTMLMISTKLGDMKKDHYLRGYDLASFCLNNGIGFYVLTASGTDEIEEHDYGFPMATADETTLKTIVRANPGYMLIRNGVITGKWSPASLPQNEWFMTLINN